MSEVTATVAQKPQAALEKSKFREYAESIIWALVLAFAIRTCVIQTFEIPSGSMENTLAVGDYLVVNKFVYGIKIPFTDTHILRVHPPRRGDVMVFEFPQDRSKDFIKRVIGVPGDEIELRDKTVYLNGAPYRNHNEVHKEAGVLPREQAPRDNFGPVRVPAGSYFMMGDNRDRSYDSRFWGFVTDSEIRGKAMIKYWSWDKESHRVRWDRIGRLIE
jgi:signal peptidase I